MIFQILTVLNEGGRKSQMPISQLNITINNVQVSSTSSNEVLYVKPNDKLGFKTLTNTNG